MAQALAVCTGLLGNGGGSTSSSQSKVKPAFQADPRVCCSQGLSWGLAWLLPAALGGKGWTRVCGLLKKDNGDLCCLVLCQKLVIWDEGMAVEKSPPSDWSVGKPVGIFLID